MENNFYITCPNNFDKFLIDFNQETGRFNHCYNKCGENLTQTTEQRLAQEAANSGGMCKLYNFACPIEKIAKDRTNHFDTIIFGHQNIATTYEKTIWYFLPSKKYMPKPLPITDCYGQEYMDLSAIINEWLKNKCYKILIDNICTSQKYSPEYNRGILFLLQVVFKDNFEPIVKKYVKSLGTEIGKKPLSLFKHQALVLLNVYKMVNAGIRYIITELPPRFGKTITWLKFFLDSPDYDIMIVYAYADTVGNSYIKEINKYTEFKSLTSIRVDDINESTKFNGKTVIYFPTTGTEKTAAKRLEKLLFLVHNIDSTRIFSLNEEADNANYTEISNNKFKMIMNTIDPELKSMRISTTGTDVFKAEMINAFGQAGSSLTVNQNNWEQIII